MVIEKKRYDLLGDLEDESDVLDEFGDHSGDIEIDTVIHEIADGAIPIYTSDIWENGQKIKYYVEEATNEGLLEGEGDIDRQLQVGYFYYYDRSLRQNLNTLIHNEMVERVNEFLNTVDEEIIDQLDMGGIEDDIEIAADRVDDMDNFTKIEEEADDVVEHIKEQIEDLDE